MTDLSMQYANYTMRFTDWVQHELIRQGIDPTDEDSAVNAFPKTLVDNMPVDTVGVPFWKRLYNKNCYKEIGFETEELFRIQFNIASESCVERFKTKLGMYVTMLPDLFNRVANLSNTYDLQPKTVVSEQYLNPVDSTQQTSVLAGKDAATTNEHSTETFDSIFSNKSNAELLEELNKARAMYEDALSFFDDMFMRVY